MIRLAVAIPAYNSTLDVGHAAMWLGLGMALGEAQAHFELVSFANYSINGIDFARNVITYDAITQAKADWLLMVDADTFHAGKASNDLGNAGVDVLQMIRDADRGHTMSPSGLIVPLERPGTNGIAMIGAPVRSRAVDFDGFCVKGMTSDQVKAIDAHTTPFMVRQIGAAFIAVNLQWLRDHWPEPPWFTMSHEFKGKPKMSRSEDYAFCDGIHERGGAVFCDARFSPAHVARRKLVGEP